MANIHRPGMTNEWRVNMSDQLLRLTKEKQKSVACVLLITTNSFKSAKITHLNHRPNMFLPNFPRVTFSCTLNVHCSMLGRMTIGYFFGASLLVPTWYLIEFQKGDPHVWLFSDPIFLLHAIYHIIYNSTSIRWAKSYLILILNLKIELVNDCTEAASASFVILVVQLLPKNRNRTVNWSNVTKNKCLSLT